jgi:hypothetical protein
MKFEAEVIEVRAKKAASLDRVIRIVLETEQDEALELQRYIGKDTIKLEVK